MISRHEGKICDQELIDTYKTLFQHPDYKQDFDKLVDLRTTDSTLRTTEGLRAIKKLVQQYHSGQTQRKTAIIASGDLSYGISRMYELMNVQTWEEIMVFRKADKAFEWLGINSEILDDWTPLI